MDNPQCFDAVGTVIMCLNDGQYQVRFDDGAELIARSESADMISDGTRVGLFAIAGGWVMQEMP